MKQKFKKAISFIEVGFILFVLFFIYTFVIKQMLSDVKFSPYKRAAAMAYTKAQSATTTIDTVYGLNDRFNSERDIVVLYAREMKAEGFCEDAKNQGCWSSNWVWAEPRKPGMKLSTGEFVLAELTSTSCSSNLNIMGTCGSLYIDTNGLKSPNLIGYDIIKVYITNHGLIPAGTKNDIINPPKNCDLSRKFSWACSARLLGVQ